MAKTLFFLFVGFIIYQSAVFPAAAPDSLAVPDSSFVMAAGAGKWITLYGTALDIISVAKGSNIPTFGISHLFNNRYIPFVFWASAEASLLALEKAIKNKIREAQSAPDYSRVNSPSVWYKFQRVSAAGNRYAAFYNFEYQAFAFFRNADIFTAYRENHAKLSLPKVTMPDKSIPELVMAPFSVSNLTNPWVYVPIAVIAAGTWFATDRIVNKERIDKITFVDQEYRPAGAVAFSQFTAAVKYNLVAVQEELIYRGILQTELTEWTTPATGIVLSSLIFGAMHIPQNGFASGAAAAVAGIYLGYRYSASGYDLGESIALHFWLDWAPSLVATLRNPKEGMYIYSISWKL